MTLGFLQSVNRIKALNIQGKQVSVHPQGILLALVDVGSILKKSSTNRLTISKNMEGKTHLTAPHVETDSAAFKPATKLPIDLEHLADLSSELRTTMSPEMRRMLELTDIMTLRSAALPASE